MAAPDVAGRLAEGQASVDRLAEYVRASEHLGNEHPRLAEHGDRLDAWYGAERGLDLQALAAAADALDAAAAAAADAVQREAAAIGVFFGAWTGMGGVAAQEFLARHQRSAETVRAALQTAGEQLRVLQARVWRAVDRKVADTVEVAAGVASDLTEIQVKQFVDNAVGNWADAMRAGSAEVDAAYAAATGVMAVGARAVFELPGELGPRWTGAGRREGEPAAVVPAALSAPAPAPAAPVVSPPIAAPSPVPEPVAPQQLPPSSSAPPAGELGASPLGGLGGFGEGLGGGSGFGSGLGSFGQQLADLIGTLVGSSGESPSDALVSETLDDAAVADDEPAGDPEAPAEDPDDPEDPEDSDELEEPDEEPDAPDAPEEDPEELKAPEPTTVPRPPEPEPPEPQPDSPPPAADPLAVEPTPCEIAADELPQIGEG